MATIQKWEDTETKQFSDTQFTSIMEWSKQFRHNATLINQCLVTYIETRSKGTSINSGIYDLLDALIESLVARYKRTVPSIKAKWARIVRAQPVGSQLYLRPKTKRTERSNADNTKGNNKSKRTKLDESKKESSSSSCEVGMIDMSEFDETQRKIIDLVIKDRSNVAMIGEAGTGKTKIINYLTSALKVQRRTYLVAAPTGIAASNINGCTLHKLAGWQGNAENAKSVEQLVADARRMTPVKRRWATLEVLIIDEISMVSATFFEKMDAMVRLLRGNDQPWGGIQLVLAGDFLQLPPVNGRDCVLASNWKECVPNVVELTNVYRQQGDPVYKAALSEIRVGKCSDATYKILKSRMVVWKPTMSVQTSSASSSSSLGAETTSLSREAGEPIIIPTSLYSHRVDVEQQNQLELKKLDGEEHTFTAHDQGKGTHLVRLQNESRAPKSLVLKVGAQVIMIKNEKQLQQPRSGSKKNHFSSHVALVNGSRGVVIAFTRDLSTVAVRHIPVVKFHNGVVKSINVDRFPLMMGEEEVAYRSQLPLMLGWALTIHKSQGMTLDCAVLDVSRCFEAGQVYVALSRIRSLSGLYLRGFDRHKIKANEEVLNWYRGRGVDPERRNNDDDENDNHDDQNKNQNRGDQSTTPPPPPPVAIGNNNNNNNNINNNNDALQYLKPVILSRTANNCHC